MKPILKPHPGWTLAEAFKLCADPDLLAARDAAHRAWVEIGAPRMLVRGSKCPQQQLARERQRKLRDAQAALPRSFLAGLAIGDLATWGRRGSTMAEPQPIPGSAWRVLKVVNWDRSIAEEPGTDRVRIFDVRVYPVFEAPDVATYLPDMPLGEAFERWMTHDPEKLAREKELAALERAGERIKRDYQANLPSKWIGWGRNDDSDLGFLLEEQDQDSMSSADLVVRTRFVRLIDLLARGRIESRGLNQYEEVQIHRAVWNRHDLHLGVSDGDLIQTIDSEETPYRTPLFRSITLYAPGRAAAHKARSDGPGAHRAPHKSTVHAANVADARRECRAWLVAAMVESPSERSQPRPEWLREALEKWPALSKRAFDTEWSSAIQESRALAWKRPGAPKKLVKN